MLLDEMGAVDVHFEVSGMFVSESIKVSTTFQLSCSTSK